MLLDFLPSCWNLVEQDGLLLFITEFGVYGV